MREGREDLSGSTLLGKLRVLRKLGTGGYGVVYEVEHTLTHNRHALKVLHPPEEGMSANSAKRLIREAGIAGRVGSPHLVQTLDVGQLEDGRPYILMELLEGRSWQQLLKHQSTLHPTDAVRLAKQVCEGLSAAHGAGVVHRDLKPANVFLIGRRGRENVKLLDFGLATNLPGHTDRFGVLTATKGVVGTPHYVSPEQGRGKKDIDGRADQYSLGVMLYESLSGVRPFREKNVAGLITKIIQGEYEPLDRIVPHLPPGLAELVHRAMHHRREERFSDIDALRSALDAFGQDWADASARTDASAKTEASGRTEAPVFPTLRDAGPAVPMETVRDVPPVAGPDSDSFPEVSDAKWVLTAGEGDPAKAETVPAATTAAPERVLAPATVPAPPPEVASKPASAPRPARAPSPVATPVGPPTLGRAKLVLGALLLFAIAGAAGGVFLFWLEGESPEIPSSAPEPIDPEQALAQTLRELYESDRSRECLERSEQEHPTAPILEGRVMCASHLGCWDTLLDSCRRLPSGNHLKRMVCTAHAVFNWEGTANDEMCTYEMPPPPLSGPVVER